MPTLERSELGRFLSEHLTAAAVMVPINLPIDPHQPIQAAYDYLNEHKFDYALVGGDRLLVLSRAVAETALDTTPARRAAEAAEPPRRDRVVERTLPLRQVTGKLDEDSYPLLVVGGDAITHIVNIADFAGVAGTAAALMTLLTWTLDSTPCCAIEKPKPGLPYHARTRKAPSIGSARLRAEVPSCCRR